MNLRRLLICALVSASVVALYQQFSIWLRSNRFASVVVGGPKATEVATTGVNCFHIENCWRCMAVWPRIARRGWRRPNAKPDSAVVLRREASFGGNLLPKIMPS